jgi:hypothetical protein
MVVSPSKGGKKQGKIKKGGKNRDDGECLIF